MPEDTQSPLKWGFHDRVGAANLLDEELRLAALRLAKTGRVYDLSHVTGTKAPRVGAHQTAFAIETRTRPEDRIAARRREGAVNDAGSVMERIEMSVHVGTHIDALGHFTIGDRQYGGFTTEETVGDHGMRELGIDHLPPIITRGVCIDVSGLDGGDYLEAGRAVTEDDVRRAVDGIGVTLAPGDVICIRTGWGLLYAEDPVRYAADEPGIDLEAARWLTSQGVCAVGSDNMAIEVTPGTDHPRIQYPVHQHLLAESGVYMIENMLLDEIARDGVGPFCFILLAVKFENATGCPVRPVALI